MGAPANLVISCCIWRHLGTVDQRFLISCFLAIAAFGGMHLGTVDQCFLAIAAFGGMHLGTVDHLLPIDRPNSQSVSDCVIIVKVSLDSRPNRLAGVSI